MISLTATISRPDEIFGKGVASMKYFSDFCISYYREFDRSRGFRLKATKGLLKAGYVPIRGFKKL
jgi:hypothetical protein